MASSKEGKVGKYYMYGLILLPFAGWSVGTFIGASAGSIFPPVVVSCLGVAIYGMFIAIITPVARRDKAVAICVLISVALSCAFRYVPFLSSVPDGFVIIICAVVASTVAALLFPVNAENEEVAADET